MLIEDDEQLEPPVQPRAGRMRLWAVVVFVIASVLLAESPRIIANHTIDVAGLVYAATNMLIDAIAQADLLVLDMYGVLTFGLQVDSRLPNHFVNVEYPNLGKIDDEAVRKARRSDFLHQSRNIFGRLRYKVNALLCFGVRLGGGERLGEMFWEIPHHLLLLSSSSPVSAPLASLPASPPSALSSFSCL